MYAQIQSQLLSLIQAGTLGPGDLLPSEEQLSRIFGVSRMTARQALQTLKTQGVAARNKGQGTYVSRPPVEQDISHLCGFTAEMRALGIKAASRVLHSGVITGPEKITSVFGLAADSPVFHLQRVRMSDGIPLAIEEIHLPAHRFPGIERLSFANRSLYETMSERYKIRLGRVDEILEARAATRREADLLSIPIRSALLVITRTLWTVDGAAVETAHSVYRGDRYRAAVRISPTAR